MTPYAKYVYRVAGIYIFWILLHYVTAHLYVRYCASPTWYGFMISPFLISAPHCIAMRWVFSKGGTVIEVCGYLLARGYVQKLLHNKYIKIKMVYCLIYHFYCLI